MELVHPNSLSETVNAVSHAFAHGPEPSAGERVATARWIAARQGLPGAYAGTFALLPEEQRDGIRLYTGERTQSAAARHIAGEEACRALRLLDVDDPDVVDALAAASRRLADAVGPVRPPTGDDRRFDHHLGGTFCCGRCSVGLWRHITAGGFDEPERRLAVGLDYLATQRSDDHGWGAFPFWYTVSALVEMPAELARPALRHASPQLERAAKRTPRDDVYGRRRWALARVAVGG